MGSRSGSPIIEVLAVFLLVYVLQIVSAFANVVGELFVLSPPIDEDPWTVVTSVYAHANIGHLVSNAIGLALVGWPVARSTTRLRFHGFFVVTGAIAGVSQILLTDLLSVFPVIGFTASPGVLGASGAVFALLGYLLASNRISNRLSTVVKLPRWAGFIIFIVVAAALTILTASPGVALVAHFTGLLVGLVAGRFNALNS